MRRPSDRWIRHCPIAIYRHSEQYGINRWLVRSVRAGIRQSRTERRSCAVQEHLWGCGNPPHPDPSARGRPDGSSDHADARDRVRALSADPLPRKAGGGVSSRHNASRGRFGSQMRWLRSALARKAYTQSQRPTTAERMVRHSGTRAQMVWNTPARNCARTASPRPERDARGTGPVASVQHGPGWPLSPRTTAASSAALSGKCGSSTLRTSYPEATTPAHQRPLVAEVAKGDTVFGIRRLRTGAFALLKVPAQWATPIPLRSSEGRPALAGRSSSFKS